MRQQFTWTKLQRVRLSHVIDVLNGLQEYTPLTLRQIYYQLVSREFIENKNSAYNALSKLLKYARIDGHISWEYVEDRVRSFKNYEGWEDKHGFVHDELRNFLTGYRRRLLQSQPNYIEVWIEKDALSSIFSRVASEYGVSVVVCRGFSSISFLHGFVERLRDHEDKAPVMLYFGDFDPSGMEMLDAMQTTLELEMGITEDVVFKRCALLKGDISKYKLPHNPSAMKWTDSRAKKHYAQHGELAVELDALSPKVLVKRIRDSILKHVDIKLYEEEQLKQEEELLSLEEKKENVLKFLGR